MTLRPALFLLCASLAAQELTIRPTLQAGDSFDLEFTSIREDSRRPQSNGRIRTPVTVRVLESNPKGFLLQWTPGVSSVDNPELVKNPVAAAAANALKGLSLEVVLGPDGQYLRLRNEAPVSAKLQTAMDAMLASLGQQLPEPQQRQTVESLVRRLMSPQVLLASATRDPQTYFALNGAVIEKGNPVATNLSQPAPFGSGTLSATFRLSLDSMDAHAASLSSTTTYDPEAFAQIGAELMAQLAPNAAPAAMPEVQFADSAAYTYNRAFGLMSDVVVRRRITAGDALNRLDGWDIRLTRRPGDQPAQ